MSENRHYSSYRPAQRQAPDAERRDRTRAASTRAGARPSSGSTRTPTKRQPTSASRMPQQRRGSSASQQRRSASGGRSTASARSASYARASASRQTGQAARPRGSSGQGRGGARPARQKTLLERIVANKVVIGVLVAVVAIAVAGGLDAATNWGKAYGNVTVNGIAVGGMTEEEIAETLRSEFNSRVSHAQVTIYADEEAKASGGKGATDEEIAIAEQISAEEAAASVGSWKTDAQSLKATVPYDEAAHEALEVGRGEGGVLARMGLLFGSKDVELGVDLDQGALEELASEIDQSIGDPRVDASVAIEDGTARATAGHDGTMVDRAWLDSMISSAMIRGDVPDSFVAVSSPAPSRIALGEAEAMADSVNKALEQGALFYYQGRSWLATPSELGDWTSVSVAGSDGDWRLVAQIDSSSAIPAVVKGADATITSEDMTVRFEKQGSDIQVKTSGSGNIPEVAPAVAELNNRLYGGDGIAWGPGASEAPEITIGESNRPESLSFDDALDLGVITAIGEYTTEFSNLEGTENRNHNIKLCADILNDAIIDANGGEWNFNDRSGDTNEEAGFWSAGSIENGEFIDSIGGGICQVATTIFNAVYEAGLDVVERHNHTLYIGSYPTGRDAAVSYPDLDFIWENGLQSDILMKLSYTDSSITAQLYSVFTGYSASTETGQWEEGKKYSVTYERDDSLPSGYYYLKTVGEDGSSITIERTVYDKNKKVVKMDSFYSEYAAKDQVYVIGPDVDTSTLARSDADSPSSGSSYYDYDGYGDYGDYDDSGWY